MTSGCSTIVRRSVRRRYGLEVEVALVLAWKTLNRICTKRLMPFLPSIIEMLEQHGHVRLSTEDRSQLFSMSAATAYRLLHAHRYSHPHGLSTTKADPLHKQQIPIRTFGKSGQGQTRLPGNRSGLPLWRANAGWPSLHDDADRCCHRVDEMSPFTQSWARSCAGCPPGHGHCQAYGIMRRQILRSLPHDDRPFVVGSTLVCCLVKDHESV